VPVPVPVPEGVAGVVPGDVPGVGAPMSGVPGVEGKPGVDGLPTPVPMPVPVRLPVPVPVPVPIPVPVPVPVLVPGAPVLVASTPKCELTRCAHVESMVGQVVLLNDGALCNLVASTFAINWSPLPRLIKRHGIATNLPPVGVP